MCNENGEVCTNVQVLLIVYNWMNWSYLFVMSFLMRWLQLSSAVAVFSQSILFPEQCPDVCPPHGSGHSPVWMSVKEMVAGLLVVL